MNFESTIPQTFFKYGQETVTDNDEDISNLFLTYFFLAYKCIMGIFVQLNSPSTEQFNTDRYDNHV